MYTVHVHISTSFPLVKSFSPFLFYLDVFRLQQNEKIVSFEASSCAPLAAVLSCITNTELPVSGIIMFTIVSQYLPPHPQIYMLLSTNGGQCILFSVVFTSSTPGAVSCTIT
jgi:hypothetical protein